MHKLIPCCALAVGMAFQAPAQTPQIKFQEYDLPNGLHVILHQDKSTPIVAVTVMYHVGSKNEQPNRTGFAHFFEHLLFEGSDNLGRGEYMKTIQNAGGQLNANTTNDRTFYYEVLPSNQLELALYMESERMLHAKIDQVGVETQREVVKEEKRLRYDNRPYGSMLPEVSRHAYHVHPYKWTTIGEMEHLNQATLEEFIQFYKDFYVPNNAILSIAGDIDYASAKALIAKYFSEVPKGTKAIYRPTIKEPAQTAEVRDTIFDNVTLPAVVQSYHVPAQGTPDYYALNLLQTYLSEGESSVFSKEIQNGQQKAANIYCFNWDREDPSVFINFAITNQGVEVKDLEKSIDDEIGKVRQNLITEKEYQKLQNQIETNFVSQNASAAGIAENLAQYKMYYGDANLINNELERYRKVTREDIRRVADKYLRPENRVVLYYLPKDNKS